MLLQATEMFTLLRRSGLDEELLAWVWEHSSMGGVSFVTVGPNVNERWGLLTRAGDCGIVSSADAGGVGVGCFCAEDEVY